MSHGTPKFDAFISYCHADREFAQRLQKWLEALQPAVAGLNGGTNLRIFRDDAELGATAVLSDSIREGLDRSAALIVIASVRASNSAWVAKEVEHFAAIRPERPMLLVSPLDADLDAVRACSIFANIWLRACGKSIEPRVAECRNGGEEHAFFEVASGLFKCDLGDLLDRHAQERERQVAQVSKALALAYADPVQRESDEENTDQLLNLIASYTLDANDWDLRHAPLLARAARTALANSRLRLVLHSDDGETIHNAVLSPNGSRVALCFGYFSDIRDVSTGKSLSGALYRSLGVGVGRGSQVRAQLLWLDDNSLIINDYVSIRRLDIQTGQATLLDDAKQHQPFVACSVSSNRRFLAAVEGQLTQLMLPSTPARDELNYRRANLLMSPPDVNVYDLLAGRRVSSYRRLTAPRESDDALVVRVCSTGERVVVSTPSVSHLYERGQPTARELKNGRTPLPCIFADRSGRIHVRGDDAFAGSVDGKATWHDAFPRESSSVRVICSGGYVSILDGATGDTLWSSVESANEVEEPTAGNRVLTIRTESYLCAREILTGNFIANVPTRLTTESLVYDQDRRAVSGIERCACVMKVWDSLPRSFLWSLPVGSEVLPGFERRGLGAQVTEEQRRHLVTHRDSKTVIGTQGRPQYTRAALCVDGGQLSETIDTNEYVEQRVCLVCLRDEAIEKEIRVAVSQGSTCRVSLMPNGVVAALAHYGPDGERWIDIIDLHAESSLGTIVTDFLWDLCSEEKWVWSDNGNLAALASRSRVVLFDVSTLLVDGSQLVGLIAAEGTRLGPLRPDEARSQMLKKHLSDNDEDYPNLFELLRQQIHGRHH